MAAIVIGIVAAAEVALVVLILVVSLLRVFSLLSVASETRVVVGPWINLVLEWNQVVPQLVV